MKLWEKRKFKRSRSTVISPVVHDRQALLFRARRPYVGPSCNMPWPVLHCQHARVIPDKPWPRALEGSHARLRLCPWYLGLHHHIPQRKWQDPQACQICQCKLLGRQRNTTVDVWLLLRHTKPITRLSQAYKNQTTEMWREKFILTRSPHTRL